MVLSYLLKIDKYGDTIDFILRVKRDKKATKTFFRKAIKYTGPSIKVIIKRNLKIC